MDNLKSLINSMFNTHYGPTTIMTSCKLHEDNEAIYFNYGRIENDLTDYSQRFKYAKYYKNASKKPEIKSFEIDEFGATLGADVYYVKDNKLFKFNVVNETNDELCNLTSANIFEITSIYLGDGNKIYLEAYDNRLNELYGYVENGEFKFSTTYSKVSITTLVPLN